MTYYNDERPHQGRIDCGSTSIDNLLLGKSIWAELNPAKNQIPGCQQKQVTFRSSLS